MGAENSSTGRIALIGNYLPRQCGIATFTTHLCEAIVAQQGSRAGAAEAIRGLIDAILLEPDGNRLKITLKGDVAGMLNAARDSKRSPETGDLLLQIKLVAGACSRRYLQLWNYVS